MSFKLWTAGLFAALALTTGCIIQEADGDEEGGAGGQGNQGGSGMGGGPIGEQGSRLFVVNVNMGVSSYAEPAQQDGRIEPATTLVSGADTDMYGPRDLAIAPNGDLYVAAENGGAVVVYANGLTADGAVLPTRKLEGAATGLSEPISIAFDGDSDTLYAVNSGSTDAADLTIFAYESASTADGDVAPTRGIEVDFEGFSPLQIAWHKGTLYAVTQDYNTCRVLVFEDASTLSGAIVPTRMIENADFGQIMSIYVDDSGLYAVDEETDLFVYAPEAATPSAKIEIAGALKLSAVTFDAVGTMFLADSSANFIYSFDGGAGAEATQSPSRAFDAIGLSLPARLAVVEP